MSFKIFETLYPDDFTIVNFLKFCSKSQLKFENSQLAMIFSEHS